MLIYTTNDPIPWFQQMHKESPVYYDPDISFYFGRKGAWQSFRHADVQKGMSDPEIFPSPAVFDIHRDNSRIMTFGHGIYHCLGRLLAKLEAKLAFETVFRHLRNIRLARENVLSRVPNIVFFRFQSLWITFDAA